MEENIVNTNEIKHENIAKPAATLTEVNDSLKIIAGAIVLAGVLIGGAILMKGASTTSTSGTVTTNNPPSAGTATTVPKVAKDDRVLGNPQAKVTLVLYEDFQCPFCGRLYNEVEKTVRTNYVDTGKVLMVYRDFAFLGPESTRAAEAAMCAGDQGKFWEFHDYLFSHQNGENQGGFADPKLKSFAQTLGLNTSDFNSCFDKNKYEQAVTDEKNGGTTAGVQGTPKGFIIKDGKTLSTIDGAEPLATVTQKLDAALK